MIAIAEFANSKMWFRAIILETVGLFVMNLSFNIHARSAHNKKNTFPQVYNNKENYTLQFYSNETWKKSLNLTINTVNNPIDLTKYVYKYIQSKKVSRISNPQGFHFTTGKDIIIGVSLSLFLLLLLVLSKRRHHICRLYARLRLRRSRMTAENVETRAEEDNIAVSYDLWEGSSNVVTLSERITGKTKHNQPLDLHSLSFYRKSLQRFKEGKWENSSDDNLPNYHEATTSFPAGLAHSSCNTFVN